MTHVPVNTLVASRASYLKKTRAFFDAQGYLEVDTPALAKETSVDRYIDPIVTTCGSYLHTSPECAMKRLLARGSGDIYFLGHVYRKEEIGSLHNPEFTMVEWYRTGTTQAIFLKELLEFLSLFLKTTAHELLPFDEAFAKYAKKPTRDTSHWTAQDIRQFQWAESVEPHLGKGKVTIIHDFPPEEAACAKTHIVNGKEKAERFEVYFKGIELGNGYAELSNGAEQEKRYIETNQEREAIGRFPIPYDTGFIHDLKKHGLPKDTYGIAVGFDRLVMLSEGLDSIHARLLGL